MEPKHQNNSVLRELSQLDICGWSVLHYFFTRPPIQKVTFLKSYLMPLVITAFLFYGLPLVVALVKVPDILFSAPNPKLLRFSVVLKFQSDLDNDIISEELRQEFEENKIPLSQDVTVSVEELGSRWLITDKLKKYSVTKEEGRLNIYPNFPVGFLSDWNMMFMNLVTLPVLVVLLLSERSMVPTHIASVIRGRAISLHKTMDTFVSSWNKRYRIVNLLGQLVGVLVALKVASANYKTGSAMDYIGWQSTEGRFNVAGWIFVCWQIPVFYWITSVYISQGLATIALLFNLTRNFKIKVSPFHHDNCCGLRSVGQIGLRNQYLLVVVGMNLLALLAVNVRRGDPSTAYLLVAGVVVYVAFGPVVFIGPLLPFRKSMLSAKEREQARVATKLQHEYTRIMDELEKRSMAKEDEELIDRLQKLKALVNRIPVWPFDISTLRRFLAAYIFPFLTALFSILISYLLKALG